MMFDHNLKIQVWESTFLGKIMMWYVGLNELLLRIYPVDDFFTSMKIWERVKHDITLDKLSVKEYEGSL